MVEKWSELTKLGMKGPLCKKNIRRGRFSAIDCPWKKIGFKRNFVNISKKNNFEIWK